MASLSNENPFTAISGDVKSQDLVASAAEGSAQAVRVTIHKADDKADDKVLLWRRSRKLRHT